METKKIAVIFPGRNYGPDCPLLYYARMVLESRGYETAAVTYGMAGRNAGSREALFTEIQDAALPQLQAIGLRAYGDVVFVSKSLGTAVAPWAEETLDIKARHILLTPIRETLPYIKKVKRIVAVAAGDADPALDAETLKAHCAQAGIRLLQFRGADHGIEVFGNVDRCLEIMKEITALYVKI